MNVRKEVAVDLGVFVALNLAALVHVHGGSVTVYGNGAVAQKIRELEKIPLKDTNAFFGPVTGDIQVSSWRDAPESVINAGRKERQLVKGKKFGVKGAVAVFID